MSVQTFVSLLRQAVVLKQDDKTLGFGEMNPNTGELEFDRELPVEFQNQGRQEFTRVQARCTR